MFFSFTSLDQYLRINIRREIELEYDTYVLLIS